MKSVILFSIVALAISSGYCQLNTGLEAKYYFNSSNANDDVGNVDGTNSNAHLTTDRFGCPNRAFKFYTDSTSFITLGDNFDYFTTGADAQFSVSIWFNMQGNDITDQPWFIKYGHGGCGENQREYSMELTSDNRVSFVFSTNLGGTDILYMKGHTVINDSLWHHVVLNYDGTSDSNNGQDRMQMYVDNNLQTMSIITAVGTISEIQDGTAHLGFGASLSSFGTNCSGVPTYDGALDDIRFYSKLLSPIEVDSLFNETSSCCSVDTSVTLIGGLLTADQAGLTYQWIDCETGMIVPGAINQFLDPPSMGYYSVVVDDGNCSDTSSCHLSACDTMYNTVYPDIEICDGDSVVVFGNYVSSGGTYTSNLSSQYGCDSIITQEVIVKYVDVSSTVIGNVLTVDMAGASYQWINCTTGMLVTGAISQFYSPNDLDSYACIVTDNGCTDTSECMRIEGLDIANPMDNLVEIYPNPSSGEFNISGLGTTAALSVYDFSGRLVFTKHSIYGTYLLDLSEFENGIYYVQLETEFGQLTKKVSLIK